MIDPSRWIVVETWLSLGLRVEWCPSYDRDRIPRDAWQASDGGGPRYVYAGERVWLVESTDPRTRGASVPEMATNDLKHELAHWMAATPEERRALNFGMVGTDDPAGQEDRATEAEKVINAMIRSCSRIASMALGAAS